MIGVVTTSYPCGADDWAGAFVRRRVRALVAGGARVEVLAAAGSSAPDQPEDGVRVLRVAAPAGGCESLFGGPGAPEVLEAGGLAAAVAAAGFTARLAALVAARAGGWQAVETHWLVPSAIVACAAAPGLAHRAFAHGGDVALLERLPAGDALARAIHRSGAALTFVTADLRARFARLCGRPVEALGATVEPAPFDGGLFHPRDLRQRVLARDSLTAPARAVVLGVGRLVRVKGFDVLVRAVGRLPRQGRPLLVIVGEGPERGCLAQLAADRGVRLRLPGSVAPPVVADWMAAADVYAQPSRILPAGRAEGMPLAVREAGAAGLPIVATTAGGLRELAGPVALVPPDDPAALAQALARILGGDMSSAAQGCAH